MGKIGKILTVAVGVGLQVIPGAGQFVGGTILGGAFAGAGVYATTAFSIGMSITRGLALYGVATGLSLAAGLFSGTPKPAAGVRQERNPVPVRTYLDGGRRRGWAAVQFA